MKQQGVQGHRRSGRHGTRRDTAPARRAFDRLESLHPPSTKGTDFDQPTQAHAHWHPDFTYVNGTGTFYCLCAMLDGWSRYLVQWGLRESMTTADVTTILQRARERFPDARPRMITGNGPQCVARDFRDCIRIAGMPHVRTAPYSPQSNGLESNAQGDHDSARRTGLDRGRALPRRASRGRGATSHHAECWIPLLVHPRVTFTLNQDTTAGREESCSASSGRSALGPSGYLGSRC
jgi:transposase InsO family protein